MYFLSNLEGNIINKSNNINVVIISDEENSINWHTTLLL